MPFDDLVGHWPKHCTCGRRWSEHEWRELPLLGRAPLNSTTRIETRTCACGGPLAVVLGLPNPD